MSHTSLEFLSDSLLFDVSLLKEKYSSISNAEMKSALVGYRDYCIKNIEKIKAEINSEEGLLRCFGSGQLSSLASLKRTALYVEQTVVSDPIFLLSRFAGEFEDALYQYSGFPHNRPVNKVAVASAVESVLATRPMVAAGYLKYYPSSLYTDRHNSVLSDVDSRRNLEMPDSVLDFYRSKAHIRSVMHEAGKPLILQDLHRSREIFIKFKDLESEEGRVYKSLIRKVSSINREQNTVTSNILVPEGLPTQEEFDDWVQMNLVNGAVSHYNRLLEEVSVATDLRAVFSTQSDFNHKVLSSSSSKMSRGIEENTIDCVLKMKLPFMEKISTQDLMSIRQSDGEEFSNFRASLEAGLRDLRTESDPSKIKEKITDFEHELSVVQIRALDLKVKSVRRAALAEIGVATIALSAGIATSGWSLFGTLAAVFQGMKTYSEYRDKVCENPCYFLWKVHNKARHK
ncbi:hypothetical protein [Pseudomonas helleri]|uniref:hypothetical protein n=1 Tax=Pseudomonas helleri TaxID=1608996 RepID=UPI00380F616F